MLHVHTHNRLRNLAKRLDQPIEKADQCVADERANPLGHDPDAVARIADAADLIRKAQALIRQATAGMPVDTNVRIP